MNKYVIYPKAAVSMFAEVPLEVFVDNIIVPPNKIEHRWIVQICHYEYILSLIPRAHTCGLVPINSFFKCV